MKIIIFEQYSQGIRFNFNFNTHILRHPYIYIQKVQKYQKYFSSAKVFCQINNFDYFDCTTVQPVMVIF